MVVPSSTTHVLQTRFASTSTAAGSLFASTAVFRAAAGGWHKDPEDVTNESDLPSAEEPSKFRAATGTAAGDSNFNTAYKSVEWHKDPEDVTNESDLPSAARLVKKDLPSAEEASKLAESWGTVKPDDDD